MTITLREKIAADDPFLLRLYATTRAQELVLVPWSADEKDAFIRMQYHAQSEYYHTVYPDMQYQIILSDGDAIGRLLTTHMPDEIRIVDISLVPEQCNKGISTDLIANILRMAGDKHKYVRLHVAVGNPAKHLYERLGFKEVCTDGVHIRMEAHPGEYTEGG
jgi:ribosomal protein S18 acetylase RimI-like enzyme